MENGEGEKTRGGLREREEELGIKKDLDEQYAMLEQLMDLANKPPAEALKELERELKENPLMQEELRDIAEANLQGAKRDLNEAKAEQQQLADSLKQPLAEDPAPIPSVPQSDQLVQWRARRV